MLPPTACQPIPNRFLLPRDRHQCTYLCHTREARCSRANYKPSPAWLTARCVTFAGDSPLEEAGFELPVPPERKAALDRVRRPSVSGETVANAILELASQLDLMGLALIFKLGATL